MPSLKNFLTGCEPWLIGFILLLLACFNTFPLEALDNVSAQPCIAKLQNPAFKNIDCTLKFDLDKKIQKDLKATTAGVVRNAACQVKVSVAREKIFTALLNEKVLEVPRQPVVCKIITNGDSFPARFTLAPQVWFKEGKAVHAKPGMDDLLGMPPFLAKLLADWVNTSKMIESAMVQEVNKFLKTGLPL
ncbi:MAG: hypothetical protein O3A78_11065 [Nitrospinae bacterium]|jgi:hypothetical protein|nr:hypothetical protein [Nitrospinota bacterium]MDA1110328.1 hypothetical protein [Nitrospinota bacterium]